jgi:hypothetical protein
MVQWNTVLGKGQIVFVKHFKLKIDKMLSVAKNESNRGSFIMFSVITNIYSKKTKGPTLIELFTATGKLKFFLTAIDVRCVHHGCTAHIDTIFKFFSHTYQHGCIRAFRHGSLQNLNILSMCAVSRMVHTSNISSCQKNVFSFPVAVNSSIKVGPFVFLL